MQSDHTKQTDVQFLEKDIHHTYVTLRKEDLENILLDGQSEPFIEQGNLKIDKKNARDQATISTENTKITEGLRLLDLSFLVKENDNFGWNTDKIHAVVAITLSGVLSVLLIGMAISYF